MQPNPQLLVGPCSCPTMSVLRTALKLVLFGAVTVLVVLLLRHWMATKQYVFNKEDIAKLVKQYAGECADFTALHWNTLEKNTEKCP